MRQILSVTCDNASLNNMMIDALAELVVMFPGATNQICCFTHILNLVVKVILCQFDMLKAKVDEVLDVASQALVDLAGDIEMERPLWTREMMMRRMMMMMTEKRDRSIDVMGCQRRIMMSWICWCVQCGWYW